jgi:alpha-methylacyl-CoA racemase
VLELAEQADVLVEGFRPGVAERLRLGPDDLAAVNPRLVYGRMTGWGQDGPLAPRAGHDLTYLALSGALAHIGRADQPPTPPLNLVADFGGGGMLLAMGILAALVERSTSGRGQVVDAAMVDGASLLAAPFHGLMAAGRWTERRGENLLDGGAPWYDTYTTQDGRHVAVGAIEPQFYGELLDRLGLAGEPLPAQHDRAGWPVLRARFAEIFASRTRDAWVAVFEGADACVAPVLSFSEARADPHNVARGTFVESEGIPQPAPAPRFSRTPGAIRNGPPERGAGGRAALRDWGFGDAELEELARLGVVALPD